MKASIATYGSLQAVVRFCKVQHAKSSWSDIPFNPVLFKKNLMGMVRNDGLDVLVVHDDAGVIQGVLLATIDQLVFNKMRYATDLHFMCESGGIQILAAFKRWAIKHGASKIIMGIANDDPTGRVHRFYEAVGMRRVGDAWVWDLQELQEIAA